MTERKYLHSFADLVDRLVIVQLKAIFISEHKKEYDEEIALIQHDVDLLLTDYKLTASDIRAITVVALANEFIWLNETKARAGGHEQDHLLRTTHAINGVRNTAKNILAAAIGGRKDYKVDCIACDTPEDAGNWNIWSEQEKAS